MEILFSDMNLLCTPCEVIATTVLANVGGLSPSSALSHVGLSAGCKGSPMMRAYLTTSMAFFGSNLSPDIEDIMDIHWRTWKMRSNSVWRLRLCCSMFSWMLKLMISSLLAPKIQVTLTLRNASLSKAGTASSRTT